jgi:hypothetical protein
MLTLRRTYEKMSKKVIKMLVTRKTVLKIECRGHTSVALLQIEQIIVV